MATGLDDLFSPERLRGNWRSNQAEVPEHESKSTGEKSNLVLHSQLQGLIKKTFEADQDLAFAPLLERLEHLLENREQLADGSAGRGEVDQEINNILDRIEDLVEAFLLINR